MSRVLVSGSSGLVGAALIGSLKSASARIARLARPSTARGTSDEERIPWDPAQPISPEAVSGCDPVSHLAGGNIARRIPPNNRPRYRSSHQPTPNKQTE